MNQLFIVVPLGVPAEMKHVGEWNCFIPNLFYSVQWFGETESGAHTSPCIVGTGSFLGGKDAGAWRYHPPPCSDEVKEREELYHWSVCFLMAGYRVNFTLTVLVFYFELQFVTSTSWRCSSDISLMVITMCFHSIQNVTEGTKVCDRTDCKQKRVLNARA
jgi:hypothetical protein